MITWAAQSWFVLLIPLVGVLGVVFVRHYLWQKRTAHQLGSELLKNFSVRRAFIKTLLRFLSVLFLVLAIGRPQWGTSEQVVEQEGRDVLIALDVSRSMLAQDNKPSRLDAAKTKIKQLLDRLTAERVSLMIFSGIAVVQCPFTSDTGAFMSFLDMADVETISSGTTAIDKAVALGIKTFEDLPGRKHRIMVLFTDGEDFSTDEKVSQQAKEAGLHLFTVGVGTPEGAPIPLYNHQGKQQGHLRDNGTTVITKLNEHRLAMLAQQTDGRYIRMEDGDNDIGTLVSEIHRFEKEKFDDMIFSSERERYALFAGLSFMFLLVEWIL